MRRMLNMILVIFLILSSLSLTVIPQEENLYEQPLIQTSSEQQDVGILNSVLWLRYRAGFFGKLKMGKYFIIQSIPPIPIESFPSAVSLNYYDKTYFDIGAQNLETGEWEKLILLAAGYDFGWMNKKLSFYFEVVPFENMDVWNIEFDPPVLEIYPNRQNLDWPGADLLLKTNVSIMLKSNVTDPSMFTQDILLKINIWRESALDKYGLLRGTPEYVIRDYEEYARKQEELDTGTIYFENPLYRYVIGKTTLAFNLFMMNRHIPFPSYTDLMTTVEVLLKVNRYHQLDLRAPETIEIQPYEVKSIPVNIQNIGSHIDTFNFRITCDNEDMIVVAPPALTLRPGEMGKALVGVAAPRTLYALGDITNICVEAFSVDDPENIFVDTVTLKSTGVYVTGTPMINLFLIVFTLIVALVVSRFVLIMLKNKMKTQKIKIKREEKMKDNILLGGKEQKEKKRKESNKKEEIETSEKREFKEVFSNFFKGFKTDKRKKRNEELEPSSPKKGEKKKSFSSKVMIVLKKWFTVPEEEKQRKCVESVELKEQQVESMQKEDKIDEFSDDRVKRDEHAYDQVIKRIEDDQKRKQAQKDQHQKELEKQRAIDRVKKAQKKQRKKLKNNTFSGIQS
ncbi:MAG: hypothetical protein QCI00_06885 [Candidatus Thermoplasmatota archaeon]|nr:hypothetical protein [Candidatus Thermoplasmatota archaeon]